MTAKQLEIIRQESMEIYGFGTTAMKKIKICRQCGTVSPITESFCTDCRLRLPKDSLFQDYRKRHKYCTACETVVSDIMQYCPQCGTKISVKTEE